MSKKITTHTGEKALVSDQYQPAGTNQGITLSKGDHVPPYHQRAKTFVLVDRTKHKRQSFSFPRQFLGNLLFFLFIFWAIGVSINRFI